MAKSEEEKVISTDNRSFGVISAFSAVPYTLLSKEVEGTASDLIAEMTQISKYYKTYQRGSKFVTEGSNGDYVPSKLHYKLSAGLIDKEARFLFADAPSITINPLGSSGVLTQDKQTALTNIQALVDAVLRSNKFEQQIVKAARDCFIGKRVAGLVNFNEQDGVTLTFIPATQFVYEYKLNSTELSKFVAYIIAKDSTTQSKRRIFMKRYTTEIDNAGKQHVYLDESLYDGAGTLVEAITEHFEILLNRIPAVVILNDGLTGDSDGESDIDTLSDFESYYSKLSNADIDAERKGMNGIKYGIDLSDKSTKNLSSAPGSFWDLASDLSTDNPHTQVGTLEPSMGYSEALDTTLRRIKSSAYEQLDIPDITLENMTGVISSGKALKAVYWPLIVRCKEKMKTWAPELTSLVDVIIKGALLYPSCITRYIEEPIVDTMYEIDVEQNIPLPEDEIEDKTMDLSEVDAKVMSKRSYMKKWRDLSDDEALDELKQIAIERQLLEESSFNSSSTSAPYPDDYQEDDSDETDSLADEDVTNDDEDASTDVQDDA